MDETTLGGMQGSRKGTCWRMAGRRAAANPFAPTAELPRNPKARLQLLQFRQSLSDICGEVHVVVVIERDEGVRYGLAHQLVGVLNGVGANLVMSIMATDVLGDTNNDKVVDAAGLRGLS